MSTSSATEAARQRNGQFGTQVRSELDPANAGFGAPEAPLPTWEDALAHAEVLREQGVKVGIDEGQRSILIRDDNGRLHDPDDGTPASQGFYPDGTPEWILHYANGKRRDPADGTPAVQWFYPDGTPEWIAHYTNGERHDPADETPAIQEFHPDGTPKWISHWTDGELVSEESFPPPTGEA